MGNLLLQVIVSDFERGMIGTSRCQEYLKYSFRSEKCSVGAMNWAEMEISG